MLFSAPMVRALLAGKKTVTRRLVNSRLHLIVDGDDDTGRVVEQSADEFGARASELAKSPYGVVGDRLWVRETWQKTPPNARAAGEPEYRFREGAPSYWTGWKPSIHMPRVASRITLEITAVRVERLQAIDETDIFAEGLDMNEAGTWYVDDGPHDRAEFAEPRDAFAFLWDGLADARSSWEANPWVWRIAFRRLP